MARENNIEWEQGDDIVTALFQNNRFQSKIRKIVEERPDDIRILEENKDGSILVQFPLKWVKVGPPRRVSEEQKAKSAERFQKYWEEKQKQ